MSINKKPRFLGCVPNKRGKNLAIFCRCVVMVL